MEQWSHSHQHARAAAIDPVCGMTVDPAKSRHHFLFRARNYFFCSAGCRGKFAADPFKYLEETATPAVRGAVVQSVPNGAVYTCPMHPQIRQIGPGACPICGMALEPVELGDEAPPNEELRDMTRRFWIGATLALPLVIL